MRMKFGIFDHIERRDDVGLAQQYEERLQLMELADEAVGATDGELDRIVWAPLADAETRLTFETERRAVARARARLDA